MSFCSSSVAFIPRCLETPPHSARTRSPACLSRDHECKCHPGARTGTTVALRQRFLVRKPINSSLTCALPRPEPNAWRRRKRPAVPHRTGRRSAVPSLVPGTCRALPRSGVQAHERVCHWSLAAGTAQVPGTNAASTETPRVATRPAILLKVLVIESAGPTTAIYSPHHKTPVPDPGDPFREPRKLKAENIQTPEHLPRAAEQMTPHRLADEGNSEQPTAEPARENPSPPAKRPHRPSRARPNPPARPRRPRSGRRCRRPGFPAGSPELVRALSLRL